MHISMFVLMHANVLGKLGREVAVKCFHVENETEETIKQFMKETAILSLLHHQNLVSL